MKNSILLSFDSSEFVACMNELSAGLVDAPEKVRDFFFGFFNGPSERFIVFEDKPASRTAITILLKPTQRLVDLCRAVRAGNFDFVVVEQSHGFSFAENELLELPILSALEKPPDSGGG